jgi:hypothetical protein
MIKDVMKSNKLIILPFVLKGNVTLELVQDRRSLTNNVLPFILGMHKIFVHVIKTCINTMHETLHFRQPRILRRSFSLRVNNLFFHSTYVHIMHLT